jgi:hypothetical protein
MHTSFLLALAHAALFATSVTSETEDLELRDLDVTGWDCLDRVGGAATTVGDLERNRMKNRPHDHLSGLTVVESLETAAFLRKVSEYDSCIQGKRRDELTTAQKKQLDSYEKQIVSLTGWLVLAYAGPPESTNCRSTTFHDWHLEIFENPSDHPPRIGDPTPIICEITPRTERAIYRDNIRIHSLAGFFQLQDRSIQPREHNAHKIRITGYLLWDDEHNGSADVGPIIQNVDSDKFHHPWRSTAWEIHPVLKIEVID